MSDEAHLDRKVLAAVERLGRARARRPPTHVATRHEVSLLGLSVIAAHDKRGLLVACCSAPRCATTTCASIAPSTSRR